MNPAAALQAIVLIALLTACTTTPQGNAIDRGQRLDIASTAAALTVEGASEANPIGLALIPAKLAAGYLIEAKLDNCSDRVDATRVMNTAAYGFTLNNLAVLAKISAAPYVGLVGGIAYLMFHEDLEPEAYSCPDKNWIRGGPDQVNPDLVIPI